MVALGSAKVGGVYIFYSRDLMQKLEASGQMENTIVFFFNDHGQTERNPTTCMYIRIGVYSKIQTGGHHGNLDRRLLMRCIAL